MNLVKLINKPPGVGARDATEVSVCSLASAFRDAKSCTWRRSKLSLTIYLKLEQHGKRAKGWEGFAALHGREFQVVWGKLQTARNREEQ